MVTILIPPGTTCLTCAPAWESIQEFKPHPSDHCLNEGADGSLEWVKQQGLDYSYSATNAGVCYGFNAPGAWQPHLHSIVDDDFYFCAGLGHRAIEEIEKAPDSWCISGTMIEHTTSRNGGIAPSDFLKDRRIIRREEISADFAAIPFADWSKKPVSLVMPRQMKDPHRRTQYRVLTRYGLGSGHDDDETIWHAGFAIIKVSVAHVSITLDHAPARIIRKQWQQTIPREAGYGHLDVLRFLFAGMGQPFEGNFA